MRTPSNLSADADAAREALRGLAHATRSIEDPTEIYGVLGSLSLGLASLEQSLHQLGHSHDAAEHRRASIAGNARAATAASHQISWELHRAGEIVHQVAAGLDRAHQVEATIAYDVRHLAPRNDHGHPAAAPGPGLSL